MYHLMRGVMTPSAATIQKARAFHPCCRCTAPFSALLHAGRSLRSKDGVVGRSILAGTVLCAHARVGLGACMLVGVSDTGLVRGGRVGRRWRWRWRQFLVLGQLVGVFFLESLARVRLDPT
jgi:hypothetical protein